MKSVLVIEDEQTIRETLKTVLESEGIPVLTAANGQEALELLAGVDCPFLIILDLMMPIMDGWEFLRVKHRIHQISGIPVLVISAGARVKPEGADAFLPKPFSVDALVDSVRLFCRTAKLAGAP